MLSYTADQTRVPDAPAVGQFTMTRHTASDRSPLQPVLQPESVTHMNANPPYNTSNLHGTIGYCDTTLSPDASSPYSNVRTCTQDRYPYAVGTPVHNNIRAPQQNIYNFPVSATVGGIATHDIAVPSTPLSSCLSPTVPTVHRRRVPKPSLLPLPKSPLESNSQPTSTNLFAIDPSSPTRYYAHDPQRRGAATSRADHFQLPATPGSVPPFAGNAIHMIQQSNVEPNDCRNIIDKRYYGGLAAAVAEPKPPPPPGQAAKFVNQPQEVGYGNGDNKSPGNMLPTAKSSPSTKLAVNAEAAFRNYKDMLTSYEQREVLSYQEIYFVGQPGVEKIGSVKRRVPEGHVEDKNVYNYGYDDARGDYILIPRDHVAYRYEIVGLLGKGSFGQVVKCFDHKIKQMVALKIIRNKKRFEKQGVVEVKVLDRLKQEDADDKYHIIHMREHFYFRGHLCISTELLGINLYEWLKAGGFRGVHQGVIRTFTHQILKCMLLLAHTHIVHCDLKPENVLLKDLNILQPSPRDCNVFPELAGSSSNINSEATAQYPKDFDPNSPAYLIKVIDFGSSCFDSEKVYTYVQSRFYRSPEVILGVTYGVGIDMWSLGCILVELYTGYPLFPGENEQEQLACIMEVRGIPEWGFVERGSRRKLFFDSNGQPRLAPNSKGKKRRPNSKPLQSLLRAADPAFLHFVERCLAWDPERRMTPLDALNHEWITGASSVSSSADASLLRLSALSLQGISYATSNNNPPQQSIQVQSANVSRRKPVEQLSAFHSIASPQRSQQPQQQSLYLTQPPGSKAPPPLTQFNAISALARKQPNGVSRSITQTSSYAGVASSGAIVSPVKRESVISKSLSDSNSLGGDTSSGSRSKYGQKQQETVVINTTTRQRSSPKSSYSTQQHWTSSSPSSLHSNSAQTLGRSAQINSKSLYSTNFDGSPVHSYTHLPQQVRGGLVTALLSNSPSVASSRTSTQSSIVSSNSGTSTKYSHMLPQINPSSGVASAHSRAIQQQLLEQRYCEPVGVTLDRATQHILQSSYAQGQLRQQAQQQPLTYSTMGRGPFVEASCDMNVGAATMKLSNTGLGGNGGSIVAMTSGHSSSGDSGAGGSYTQSKTWR
ncbi:hypothetical protein SeLEV6574_g06107 [Synchytrium endobioticum]|uniref:dual-specificity kinase n=1 Tax=Synchytrium endobioticum TaxID=286115 RepID=A0A507CQP8_9FUNG|nr:hypothetical protein SeLEV6574_g06107 [Synchytrium endobioticum]